MATQGPKWEIKGIYNEACASEGHCPYYFGRDKEGGCRYFMVFRITEGEIDEVDLAGTAIVYVGDLPHSTFAEVEEKGSEGAIYISSDTTPAQRAVLDTLAVEGLGGVLMGRVLGVSYVDVSIEEGEDTVHVRIPAGEMKMKLTRSRDGEPVRLENVTLPFIHHVKAAHTPFWHWSDYDRHFAYRDRCGTWADFTMSSEPPA